MAVLRVKEAFAVSVGGATQVFPAGHLVNDDDPVVKGREALFETVEAASSRSRGRRGGVVEAATAEPGEKRSVSVKKSSDKSS